MNNQLSEEQIKELDEKLTQFEKFINSQIELHKENDQKSINNGEYNYLVKETSLHSDIELTEELQELLDKSSLSLDSFIDYCVENDHFESSYEELSSPFQYGGQAENEICTISWGGDREVTIDQSNVVDFQPSFSLQVFNNFNEFQSFVSYHIGSIDYLNSFWSLSRENKEQVSVIYNTDYDLIRVSLSDEDRLIEYLKENVKPVEKKEPVKTTITVAEYKNYRKDYCGYCINCGHFSDGSHEPDAQEYECEKCNNSTSYGIDHALVVGYIIIEE